MSEGGRTIKDFGRQWQTFTANEGYYGSVDLLKDVLEPLVPLEEIRNKRVAEIGSGTGRFVKGLVAAGAAHVIAIEPSDGFAVLVKNTEAIAEHLTRVHDTGEKIDRFSELDLVVSIGVVHHIPEPLPVLKSARKALKPGGSVFIWVYGHEGTSVYRAFLVILRGLRRLLPHRIFYFFCGLISLFVEPYALLCRFVHLPLRTYLVDVWSRLSRSARVLVVYDQLNPKTARYYRGDEVRALLESAGFVNIRMHNRHRYSWSARAETPAAT